MPLVALRPPNASSIESAAVRWYDQNEASASPFSFDLLRKYPYRGLPRWFDREAVMRLRVLLVAVALPIIHATTSTSPRSSRASSTLPRSPAPRQPRAAC